MKLSNPVLLLLLPSCLLLQSCRENRTGASAEMRPRSRIAVAREDTSAAAALEAVKGSLRRYGSDSQNGRVGLTLPSGTWRLKWQSVFTTPMQPSQLLQAADRIVVAGTERWQLHDRQGRLLRSGSFAAGPVIDPPNRQFLLAEKPGSVLSYSLDAGRRIWELPSVSSEGARRTYLARRQGALVVATEYRDQRRTLVESFELGDSPQISDEVLTSARRVALLEYPALGVRAAAMDNRLALAMPGRLVVTDRKLRLRDEYDRPITDPASISLDEAGHIYMLAGAPAARELLVFSSKGEELLRMPAGRDDSPAPVPPAIDFRRHIRLTMGDRLLAISPAGDQEWTSSLTGIAGLLVTADNRVVVAAANGVHAFTVGGERKLLFGLNQEPLLAGPVLTAEGDLLLASAARLFCLSSH
ncbi:MAG: hypothetical protein K2X35_15795 [Bryobacteraceae bacterium]|nr:hypothetical protein [Bryobacteraceae bacterium]